MIVGSVVYLFLVRRCQLAEDEVSGLPAERGATVSKVVAMIRATRFWIILAIGIGETALMPGMRFSTPVFNCSNAGK